MRRFSSEFVHSYATYSFGYANYMEREPGDSLSEIYEAGFLPYSGSPEAKNIFYMARSARIPLSEWKETSENRRIGRRFDGAFERIEVPTAEFNAADPVFLEFCLAYFRERHGSAVMPEARLRFILESGTATHISEYRKNGELAAAVLEARDTGMSHFWFSFYDTAFVQESLGLWLMLDQLKAAKERGAGHFYIGTVYGEKALYKTNFDPLEYWTGEIWSTDIAALKQAARGDAAASVPGHDAYKEGKDFF